MLPKWYGYGNWPASGEIDIVEARGKSTSRILELSEFIYRYVYFGVWTIFDEIAPHFFKIV